MRALLILVLVIFGFTGQPTVALGCGPDTDCTVEGDRYYRIRLPEGYDGKTKIGALVWSHGYRGTARGMMNNASMAKMASELGVALIATKSAGDDWQIPGVPRNTDISGEQELSYFDAVIEDATSRFAIDRDRLMATGFSAGGMMVWNLICHRSQSFAGFAPISGTFWQPEPTSCSTPPASVVHVHGDRDRIVPLMGRPIADTHQGEVPTVLAMYAKHGGFGDPQKVERDALSCEDRRNSNGEILNFCMFSGGHSFRSEFVRQAWEMLSDAGKL